MLSFESKKRTKITKVCSSRLVVLRIHVDEILYCHGEEGALYHVVSHEVVCCDRNKVSTRYAVSGRPKPLAALLVIEPSKSLIIGYFR